MTTSVIINETSAILVTLTGIIAATVIFIKNALSVKKLQFEFAKLEEIEKYAKSINKWNGVIAVIILVSLSSLFYSLHFYSDYAVVRIEHVSPPITRNASSPPQDTGTDARQVNTIHEDVSPTPQYKDAHPVPQGKDAHPVPQGNTRHEDVSA